MNIVITKHARQRMSQRCISYRDIENTISKGHQEPTQDKIKYILEPFHIVTLLHENDTIVVVTVHYSSVFNHQIRKLTRKHNISTRKAIKIIRGID